MQNFIRTLIHRYADRVEQNDKETENFLEFYVTAGNKLNFKFINVSYLSSLFVQLVAINVYNLLLLYHNNKRK